jgi:hypothetical protein
MERKTEPRKPTYYQRVNSYDQFVNDAIHSKTTKTIWITIAIVAGSIAVLVCVGVICALVVFGSAVFGPIIAAWGILHTYQTPAP